MEHLPASFRSKSEPIQNEIVELGLYCWSLIEQHLDDHKTMDQTEIIKAWKEKGKKQAKQEFDQVLKEKELIIKTLEFERDHIETRCQKQFEQEKKFLISTTRFEVEKEFQQLKEEKIRLQTRLETQEDLHIVCRNLSNENESLKQEIDSLTKVKSSAAIGNDGEDEVEILLSKTSYEFDKIAKEKGGHKGDFRIKTQTNKIFLLDSKKYSSNVSKKEKEKLASDVDRDETVHGGIFVSLTSGIANQTHGDIIVSKNYKPILFLSFVNMTQEAKEEVLKVGIKLLEKYTSLHEEKERTDLIEKIKEAIQVISELVSRFKNMEKWADEIKSNAKIGIQHTEALLKVLQMK